MSSDENLVNLTSVVVVRWKPLESREPEVWKPAYKRLCGIAKLKGYPLCRCLPGLGGIHFDGKNFRPDYAYVAFEFNDWKECNHFATRLKKLSGVRAKISGKFGWYKITNMDW